MRSPAFFTSPVVGDPSWVVGLNHQDGIKAQAGVLGTNVFVELLLRKNL
jgi:hypothetical protein